jgi:hypothetical protein
MPSENVSLNKSAVEPIAVSFTPICPGIKKKINPEMA